VFAILGGGVANATTNLVQNGGFEGTTLTPAQQAQVAGHTGFQVTYPGGTYANAVNNWTSAQDASHPNAYNLYFFNGATAKTGDAFSQYPSEQQRPNANFTGSSPNGGAFMILDGDPGFAGPLSQMVGGLTVGKTYQLSFYWAGGELSDRTGYQTIALDGSFGGSNFSTPTFTNTTASPGAGDFSGWQLAHYDFTATSTSQLLSFMANGTPAANLPPVAFLDGVSVTGVPEPGAWALMLVGVGALGVALRRRRRPAVLAA
jgi:hypothetical protein